MSKKYSKMTLSGILMLCLPLPLLFTFLTIEERLLSSGFLNKRDLGFVGGESGTLYEYMTNIWHWDAFGVLLMLLIPVGFFIGLALILAGRNEEPQQSASASPPQGIPQAGE